MFEPPTDGPVPLGGLPPPDQAPSPSLDIGFPGPGNVSTARRRARSQFGPIIDAHSHPLLPGEPPIISASQTAEEYLRRAKGLDLRFTAAFVIAPRQELEHTRALNDKVLELGRRTDGRFFPVCSVHPHDRTKALAEVDRVATAGARALKLHPNTQGFDVADGTVRSVVERATRHRLPVVFDGYSPFDANQPGKFVQLAMAVPEARIVVAHAHGPQFPALVVYEVLARYPWWRRNVWIDLSATASLFAGSPFAEQLTWVLRKVGIDRLLFASDYPLDDPVRAAEAVVSLGFTRTERTAIFYDNAAQLFGLPPR